MLETRVSQEIPNRGRTFNTQIVDVELSVVKSCELVQNVGKNVRNLCWTMSLSRGSTFRRGSKNDSSKDEDDIDNGYIQPIVSQLNFNINFMFIFVFKCIKNNIA